eukprot:4375788-Alexandrium_andersonii.AAC.1
MSEKEGLRRSRARRSTPTLLAWEGAATAGAAGAASTVLQRSGGARSRGPSRRCFRFGRLRTLSALRARTRSRPRFLASFIASTA